MFIRGETFKHWVEQGRTDECYTQKVENGCHVEVRAREQPDGDIEIFVSVYTATGQAVAERVKTLPGNEWNVEDALKRGIDQAERIAGGEAGRLPCADARAHANE
ncbi:MULTISPECIES: hypothetical protein [Pseudomonas]|uniref:hypothetical protein n=1 Tax=Pseudomonas sp. SIMBA_041 TaxID=3085782 RepID=UPI0039789342